MNVTLKDESVSLCFGDIEVGGSFVDADWETVYMRVPTHYESDTRSLPSIFTGFINCIDLSCGHPCHMKDDRVVYRTECLGFVRVADET